MSTSLYEMSENYLSALNVFTDPDNDIDQQTIDDTLEALEGEIEEKILNVAKFIVSIENESEGLSKAEKRIKERKSSLDNKADELRKFLLNNLVKTGKDKVKDNYISVSTAKTPKSVHIIDEDKIPSNFLNCRQTWVVDKIAIKAAGGCEGVEIKSGLRVSIK